MPVLEGILLSAEKGLLTLSSYNLEMGMKKEMYAACEEEGDIVINARLLADILRKLRGLDVEIESDERLVCHIRSGEAVFDIMGMDATDFPEMPSLSEGENLNIDGEDFCDLTRAFHDQRIGVGKNVFLPLKAAHKALDLGMLRAAQAQKYVLILLGIKIVLEHYEILF